MVSLSIIGVLWIWANKWILRVLLCVSLGGHLSLALLANVRRREGLGVRMALLWMAYQVVDQVAPFLLSSLSFGSSTPREQQVMEIWVPFIVAHIAGPDNITGYSLDDNKLSTRVFLNLPWQLLKIILPISKQFKVVTSRGALFGASLVMIAVGFCKYFEKLRAFSRADFGNISSSRKKKPERLQIHGRRKVLGNEQALLLAHHLLHITISAFADKFYLTKTEEEHLQADKNLKEIFFVEVEDDKWKNRIGWSNMCKVVEMELSLMYDILYTKAAVIRNWHGFAIRAISPVVTAMVMVLFWLTGSNDGQRTADVIITCILLSVTFLLDVRWLLGAAASTWTYTFFSSIPCLHHQVCCRRGWWRRLRRFVESLDPLWRPLPFPLRMHGGGYRLWSGTMGQYNLFHESNQQDQGGTAICRLWSTLRSSLAEMLKIVKLEDVFEESRYCSLLKLHECSNNDVKELLFKQIQEAFKMYMKPRELMAKQEPGEQEKSKSASEEEEKRPKVLEHQRRRKLDEELDFLPEFQEAILIWHVTTEVFLSSSSYAGQFCCADEQWKKVKAIRAVSDYMAFLAVVRRDMMPGLKLSSVHQSTRDALEDLWKQAGGDRERLICKLKDMEGKNGKSTWFHNGETMQRSALYDKSPVLSDGVKFAFLLSERLVTLTHEDWEKTLEVVLTKGIKSYYCSKWCDSQSAEQELQEVGKSNSRKRFEFLIPDLEDKAVPLDMETLLQVLLESWVRLLIYISVRCGRDAHAKQLGRGGELTTIVWILSEHAGIFAPKTLMENKPTTHGVCCAAPCCL